MLEHVYRFMQEKDYDRAFAVLDTYLFENPDDIEGTFYLGTLMMETNNPVVGKLVFEKILSHSPNSWEAWNNYGRCLDDLLMYEEAAKAFFRAKSLSKDPIILSNISVNAVHRCKPDMAIEYADKYLEYDSESVSAHLNKGFAHLMKREFDPGWKEYEWGMGRVEWRDAKNYAGEPIWQGEKGKRVIVYGEQGIGDQIALAGAIPDMRKDCKNLILDVNKKLSGLFTRSFICNSYGTMLEPAPNWVKDHDFDASCSLSEIQKFYRDDSHKFNGKPYLVSDPVRTSQWKHTLKEMGDRPKIGIAWTGGKAVNDSKRRSTDLETFLPILKEDADFISLEYKDRSKEIEAFHVEHGIKIHDFPWATQTSDYDDTAALVKNLDLVISVPTSVVHLAGGLGVTCYCILHETPHFLFGLEGESMPFYDSVKLFRRKAWGETLNQIKESIRGLFSDHSRWSGTRRSA